MLGKRLSESMSDIGDDLIADAMEYRAEKKRNVWLRVAAVAAVVAMVIGLTAVLWDGTEPGEQMGMPTVGTTVAPTQLPTTLPDVPTVPTESQGYELVKVSGVLKVYACDKENVSEEELKKYFYTCPHCQKDLRVVNVVRCGEFRYIYDERNERFDYDCNSLVDSPYSCGHCHQALENFDID